MGCILGIFLYIAMVCLFEVSVAPLIFAMDQPFQPYGGMIGFMSLGGGFLGLMLERMLRAHQTDKAQASRMGAGAGLLSLLVNFWLIYISTPRTFSYLERGNVVVFGPLIVVSLVLLIWSAASSVSNK